MLDSASVSPLAPRRPGDQKRPADHHVAIACCVCCLLCVQELAEISPPLFVSVQAGRRTRLPCPLHLRVRTRCVRTKRDGALGNTTQCARFRELDRRRRESRGGRRGESPARSKSGRTPALPPRVHAVCAPCVRDEARTPHPCPSPPMTFRPGSAAPLPTVFGRHPMRPKLAPQCRLRRCFATPSSLRPVQNDSRRARTQGSSPRNGHNVSR
jgi:hypothetical protein